MSAMDESFEQLLQFVRDARGFDYTGYKRPSLMRRFRKRMDALHVDTFDDYRAVLEAQPHEFGELFDTILINVTSFFRDADAWQTVAEQVIPTLLENSNGERVLRVWSAGCSSGEEAYSIAMTLREAAKERLGGWDAKILATDIDTNMVATGGAGIYDAARAATIPAACRARYVEPNGKGSIAIDAATKSLISFLPLNLLEEWPMRGTFDAIFCRNVVIYFDKPTQKRLFDRFADILTADGFLYVGHSETLFRTSERFVPVGRTVYRKAA
jgi:chemotaxis protein methyltransferase CheR